MIIRVGFYGAVSVELKRWSHRTRWFDVLPFFFIFFQVLSQLLCKRSLATTGCCCVIVDGDSVEEGRRSEGRLVGRKVCRSGIFRFRLCGCIILREKWHLTMHYCHGLLLYFAGWRGRMKNEWF